MEKYELLYIIPAKYTDAEVDGLIKKISGLVSGAGATVSATHHLGARKLAYPIKHVRNGHYVLTVFDAEAPVAVKLNEILRLSTDVLRHLIVKRDPRITAIPSLVEEEEFRGRRDDLRPRPRAPVQLRPQMPAPTKPAMTSEELEKKLDEILTEEIL